MATLPASKYAPSSTKTATNNIVGYNQSGAKVYVAKGYTPGISAERKTSYPNSNPIQTVNSQGMTAAQMAATPTNIVTPEGNIQQPENFQDKFWKDFQPANPYDRSYEETMRQAELQRQQEDINVINNTYAGILAGAQRDQATRANITDVVNANAGLRGSNIGAANVQKTAEDNQAQTQTINNAQLKERASVVNQHREFLSADITKERELRQTNYSQWVDYMGGKEKRAAGSAATLMKGMIANGDDPASLDEKFFADLSKGTGLSAKELQSAYAYDYKQNEATAAEAASKRLNETADYNKTIAETNKIKAEASAEGNKVRDNLSSKGYSYIKDNAGLAGYKEVDLVRLADGSIMLRPDNLRRIMAEEALKPKKTGTGPIGNARLGEVQSAIEAGGTLADIASDYPDVPFATLSAMRAAQTTDTTKNDNSGGGVITFNPTTGQMEVK